MAQRVEALVARIAEIDRQIDLNRAALYLRLRCIPGDARGWQNAWDRNPSFHARERDLFCQRGIAQERRDAAEHKAHLSEQRRLRRQRAAAAKPQAAPEIFARCGLTDGALGAVKQMVERWGGQLPVFLQGEFARELCELASRGT